MGDRGERWRAIEALFYRALEQDPADRDRFLDQSCVGDAELRQEVASLLSASEMGWGGLEDFLDQTIRRVAADAVMPPSRRVGRYRLIREIGHGGMGVVYLAERADGEYEQRVAIKLVKGHVASEEARRRFLIERQILARLEHSSIARLLDGGTTEDGTPYLVMEYVDGEPIDEWCRARAVDVERRLELFLRVCDAVESAHRQLIVHRDLKPSNVLVTRDGRPRLLDFGVAKLLDDDETGATHTVERRLTPAYASPEQALGRPISTATDVYSLGAVLYELLAGRPAFALTAERTPAQLLDAICTVIPPRPSLAAGQGAEKAPDRRRLRRRLEGELDAIVMTALRKEPERRYASVAALTADLRRHLAGLPVTAHSERWSYLAGKWVSRHRLAVGAALVALVSLLGGLVLATQGLVEVRRANRELATANQETVRESEKLAAVNEFLIDMLSASDPGQQGATVKVVDLLRPAAERLPEVFADQPEVASALTETLGQAYLQLGLLAEAEEVLRRGRVMAAERLGPSSTEALRLERGLAATLLHRERFAEAAELLSAGMADREKVLGIDHEETIQARLLLAQLLALMGRPEQAEGLVRRVLDQRVAGLGANHPDTLDVVHVLGGLFESTDREAEATELFEWEVAGRQQLLDPDDPATVYPLVTAMNYLSASFEGRGMRHKAMRVRREVVDLMRRVEAPPDRIAQALSNLGVSFEGEGRFDEAAELYREALSELSEVDAAHPGRLVVLSNLGDALLASGRLPEAIPAYREVVDGSRRTRGPEHSGTTLARVRLARALARGGECGEALETFRRTGRIDPEDSLIPWLHGFHGVLHAAALLRCGDDRSGAEELLGPAVDELLRTAAPTSFMAREAIGQVIEVFEALGDGTRADELRALLESPRPEDR